MLAHLISLQHQRRLLRLFQVTIATDPTQAAIIIIHN